MKNDNIEVSLKSIGFIIQHPWCFISPAVIIMSLVYGHISSLPLRYECDAIISFSAPAGELIGSKFVEKKKDLLSGVLIGENIRMIVKEVWPHVKEETNPIVYNNLIERLRNPQTGIKMAYDKKQEEYLTISFMDSDPNICYNVVRATIDTIRKANKEKVEIEMESGLAILRKQLEFYRDKLKVIDEETTRLKSDLQKRYPEMSDSERTLIDEVFTSTQSKEYSIQTQMKIQKFVNYDEKFTELNLQLLDLKKKKEELKKSLKNRDFESQALTMNKIEEDPFAKGYDSSISNKELAMTEFLSQGYTEEHPQIRKVQAEIDNLKILKEKRIKELVENPRLATGVTKILEESINKQIRDIDSRIDTLRLQMETLEAAKRSFEKKLNPTEAKIGNISSQTSRLMELINEKDINQRYYQEIRQQLELAEIKNRLQREEASLKINIVEEPKIPLNPIPLQKVKTIILGIMISISAGMSVAYFADSLDKSIKSSSELRELLQIPVLASIDKINTPQDIRLKQIQRNAVILGLFSFVILSQIFVKVLKKIF